RQLCVRAYGCGGFFVQAEDGIRDRTVTGVQTCALPISWRWLRSPTLTNVTVDWSVLESATTAKDVDMKGSSSNSKSTSSSSSTRSEERRAGKESRAPRGREPTDAKNSASNLAIHSSKHH